jgi:NTP pyrophosphatase (non-canonical NTP hydrolase)
MSGEDQDRYRPNHPLATTHDWVGRWVPRAPKGVVNTAAAPEPSPPAKTVTAPYILDAVPMAVPYMFSTYQEAAARTLRQDVHTREYLLANMAIGLAGETGEVCEPIKKHLYHGKPLDVAHVALEIGDCLWYLNGLCKVLGITLAECAQGNVAKLLARHPTNNILDTAKAEAGVTLQVALDSPEPSWLDHVSPRHAPPVVSKQPEPYSASGWVNRDNALPPGWRESRERPDPL